MGSGGGGGYTSGLWVTGAGLDARSLRERDVHDLNMNRQRCQMGVAAAWFAYENRRSGEKGRLRAVYRNPLLSRKRST